MSAAPRAILALIVMSLIWGYNWVLVKEAMRLVSPFDFSAIRTIGGGVLLLGVLAWKGRPLRPRNVPMTLLVGFLCTTVSVGTATWALVEGGAGKMAILVYAMPFWLILMAWPLLGERPRGLQWPAVALALAGLVLLLEPWNYRGDWFPSTLAVASGLAWAASAVVTKRMDRLGEVDVISLSAWQVLFGGLFLAAVALAVPSAPIRWTPWMAGAMTYNVVLTSAVAILMWFYVLKVLPAGLAGLGSLATPVLGLFFAYALLGERFSFWEGWGGVLIVAALSLLVFQGLANSNRS
ncbi:MAG: DMT family transporter [Syntrophales bacterium]|jgi:drug/metabolite transporter (DMT)-like permease|nr:DMT family transporter [Syntrophales bacterium]MCU0554466.1 DMT family transporter [Syntrophales bacterium]